MEGWRNMHRIAATGLALGLFAGAALAQPPAAPATDKPAEAPKEPEKPKAPALKIGDKAPELAIANWVKGDPITGFEKGRVYVVEFWATWCGPCKTSIPHLTEMAHKFKKDNVTFIGISSTDEDVDTVKAFVKDMGDKMDYSVAVDKGSPEKAVTDKAWMQAAGEGGIPTAFVVDKDQKIAWIGHPMDGLEKVLDDVVAGKWDPKKYAEARAKKIEAEKAAEKAMESLQEAAMNRDWDKACKLLDEMIAKNDDFSKQAAVIKFQMLLMGKKDYPAAYAHAGKAAEGVLKDDAEALNSMSWAMLDSDGLEKRDYDLAMKIALRAVEVSKGENGMILDTLARAYFEKGDLDKALEFQTKAVAKGAPTQEIKDQMQEVLEKYKAAKAKKDGEKK